MGKFNLYSYIRWSSDKQAEGASLQRQLETARRVAHENDLELVEIIDEGVSAFKSRHLEKGNLVAFVERLLILVKKTSMWACFTTFQQIPIFTSFHITSLE